jgi:hypothetical protein
MLKGKIEKQIYQFKKSTKEKKIIKRMRIKSDRKKMEDKIVKKNNSKNYLKLNK